MAEPQATAEEIADATLVEEPEAPTTTALVRHETPVSIVPQATAEELGQRLQLIKRAMENEMVQDVDYGVIPGTDKPTLLKPGAEKLSVLFRLDVQYTTEKQWQGDHLTVFSHATVYDQVSGARLGAGEGACSTREKKYAWRQADRTCPQCGKATIRRSNKDDEFYCWRKIDGCGAKFPLDDQRITSQQVGRVDNPDLPDYWNTVIKMAKKRALIDAVLVATSASAIFTQDVEEQHPPQEPAPEEPPVPADPFGRPFGRALDREHMTEYTPCCTKIAAGDKNAGRALWNAIVERCGGYMPEAAAIALMEASKALTATPLDPEYVDPTGDIPTEDQAEQERAVREGEIAGLEDQVLQAWLNAGVDEPEALKKVQECQGRKRALQLSFQAADRTVQQRRRVEARA